MCSSVGFLEIRPARAAATGGKIFLLAEKNHGGSGKRRFSAAARPGARMVRPEAGTKIILKREYKYII